VPEFRQKLAELNHNLIKEVGTYQSTKLGDAHIYDLGGNAAEWHSGSGGSYGYSAISFVDERSETTTAPVRYTSFRVIKE